jgi:hypothetical protein
MQIVLKLNQGQYSCLFQTTVCYVSNLVTTVNQTTNTPSCSFAFRYEGVLLGENCKYNMSSYLNLRRHRDYLMGLKLF